MGMLSSAQVRAMSLWRMEVSQRENSTSTAAMGWTLALSSR